MVVIVFINK